MERMLAQILESILSKVGESFYSKLVEQTADNAHNSLKSMNEFKVSLKTLQKRLKALSAKASDVEEEIKNAELSSRKKRKREVEEWLEEVKLIENEVVELGRQVESEGFITRLMDGGKVAKLNDDVEGLVEQSRNFGELVLDVCGTEGETFLTNGMVGEAFNDNMESILELLETRRVSSIGVYGMGGVGKTTLAMHINNRLVQQSQGPVFWVTVSQEFTVTSLQDKIARLLGIDFSDEDNEGRRATRLHRELSKMKNSVLILDDVWENIDFLKVGCPVSEDCCRLIITTRSLKVCRQIHCQKEIVVKKLGEDEAWKLFNETLGNEVGLGPQVEEIAKNVAKMCDGLPLGVITLAGSMRGERAIHTWKNALGELKERVVGQDEMGEEDEVFKVLKYSFDRLNMSRQQKHSNDFNTFQLCFLYCSLYPEDYKILRNDLVRKFISEGLMDRRKSRRAQIHQGHSILDKLVNVCLLESGVNFEEYVKMHDLVRGMALMVGEGKYMVRAGDYSLKEIPDEEEWTEGLEKVSLMMSGISRIGDGTTSNCPKLSTLVLGGSPLHVIPISFFSKMQCLCTLDLCETDITMLPDSIGDMKSLKALFLEYCYKLENVPYLGKLKALRELNLSATAIKEVPQGLEELLNLKFLSLDADGLKMLPRGLLLELRHLQHVNIPLQIEVPIEELENLMQLEEFSGRVKNVSDFNGFITSRMHDTCFKIGVGLLHTYRHKYFEVYNNELILCEVNLKDEKVFGQGVAYVTIKKCEGLSICFVDDFSRLDNPTSLKRVRIEGCGGIECISSSEQGSQSKISNLELIELVELEDLKGLIKKEEIGGAPAVVPTQAVFSSLRRLIISKCKKMVKLGLPVLGVPNLEYIEIEVCGEMEEIFEDEGRGSVTLPKLKELSLHELPRVTSLCKATMICNSIMNIEIVQCPRLMKKLPVHMDVRLPSTLRVIRVSGEWWESLEWDNPDIPQLLHPFLQLF